LVLAARDAERSLPPRRHTLCASWQRYLQRERLHVLDEYHQDYPQPTKRPSIAPLSGEVRSSITPHLAPISLDRLSYNYLSIQLFGSNWLLELSVAELNSATISERSLGYNLN
jgi:hypothetical protein